MAHRPGTAPGGPRGRRRMAGQATVEFSLASLVFLAIVLGTIDFGRVAFTYSMLHNAIREGARVGKVACSDTAAIRTAVIDGSPTLGLTAGQVTVTTPGGCDPPTGTVRVQAQATFSAVSPDLLGIAPITLTARATVDVE
jgi:Flp pilus assembly protein TadG